MKRLLLVLFLSSVLVTCGLCQELVECGDGICSASESRSSCPGDCCLTSSDGVCEWPSECGAVDPDCCAGACFSDAYVCTGNGRGTNCYPGTCSSGSCSPSCASFDDCPSGFCGAQCSLSCVPDGGAAADVESCCECYSAGSCHACGSLAVSGPGFLLYRGSSTALPMQLFNATGTLTNVHVHVSGPLRAYVTLGSQDPVWEGDGFSRINHDEVKSFTVTFDAIPDDRVGMFQTKLSIIYDTGAASHLMWVAVLPVNVMEQGRDPPSSTTVGVSRRVMRMVQGNATVPVEAIMQVW